MCPLKREQARPEMQLWVMRRLPIADSIVEIERKSRPRSRIKRDILYTISMSVTGDKRVDSSEK